MMEGMFRRPPEDDAIPVLTEVIALAPDTTEPGAAPAAEAQRDYRADPMSIDFAAELIPMPATAPPISEMPFPPAAIAGIPTSPDAGAPAPSFVPSSVVDAGPPGSHLAPTVPALSTALAAGLPADASPLTRTQRLALLPDLDLIAFEEQLRAAVITRLHPRIDPMLDHRIGEAIRQVLEAELPALREKLRTALTDTLQDVVSRAISKELAKIHSAHANKN